MLKVDATDRVHPRRFGDARFGSAVPGHGYLLFAGVVPLWILRLENDLAPQAAALHEAVRFGGRCER